MSGQKGMLLWRWEVSSWTESRASSRCGQSVCSFFERQKHFLTGLFLMKTETIFQIQKCLQGPSQSTARAQHKEANAFVRKESQGPVEFPCGFPWKQLFLIWKPEGFHLHTASSSPKGKSLNLHRHSLKDKGLAAQTCGNDPSQPAGIWLSIPPSGTPSCRLLVDLEPLIMTHSREVSFPNICLTIINV